MIIKGEARGRSRQLAAHLLRRDQNEDIRLYELRGVTATDIPGALAEIEALTAGVHSNRPLYHASISPEAHRPLSQDQIRVAADTLERKLGLDGQARVIVVHRKQGREHLHVVWSRIDLERGRVVSDAWNYRAHEAAARELEAAFGHRAIAGVHVPQSFVPRPRRAPKDYEYRQAERSGRSPTQVGAELTALWHGSDDAEAFRKKLEEAGYTLARGDRRVFVVIDRAGNVHSLARRLGLRSRDVADHLRGLELDDLRSVSAVRAASRRLRRGSLDAPYRAASQEITSKPARSRAMSARIARASVIKAIRWINLTEHTCGTIMRHASARLVVRDWGRYRAMRAIILSEFAAKMDAACRNTADESLSVALARLMEERDAALSALEQREKDQGGERRPTGRPKQRRARFRTRRAVRREKT